LGEHIPSVADSGGYVLIAGDALHLSPNAPRPGAGLALREHFLKLGAQVIVTVRRIVLHLPQRFVPPIALSSRFEFGRQNWLSSPRH